VRVYPCQSVMGLFSRAAGSAVAGISNARPGADTRPSGQKKLVGTGKAPPKAKPPPVLVPRSLLSPDGPTEQATGNNPTDHKAANTAHDSLEAPSFAIPPPHSDFWFFDGYTLSKLALA
jgi:hypothetical protein